MLERRRREERRGERRGEKREEKREGRGKQSDMVGEILTTEILSSMSTPPHPVNYHRLIALTRFLHCCTEIEIVDIALRSSWPAHAQCTVFVLP